jgi:hypothetical protein
LTIHSIAGIRGRQGLCRAAIYQQRINGSFPAAVGPPAQKWRGSPAAGKLLEK